ncbi:HAD hydrolase family protein [Bacillus thermotolerans]|uniref:Hydrolase (HAD superfamily) n=1 Tax=Bacillus thermotolerans TaxID=1221996 RepID=A0A0F5HRJ0_BACTR|nr:HAD hydrolase family protein [Bacillus thermotolerans]KKB35625.1 Hydrolase (HAD superfamily) [Bacillus thermotolerans]KKB40456.1 Hydrolase (HAD superfamily) [Bacillus thermotolerans]KKB41828.1 Hydrolase (HAD superfamily) [Bacillus thermotolerans]
MAYKLLAINIDALQWQNRGRVMKSTKEAIRYVHKKQVAICFYSNRELALVKKAAKSLHPQSCLIAHGGAYVSSESDKPVFIQRINEDVAYEIVQFLESFDCRLTLSNENFSVSNRGRLPKTLVKRNVWQRTQRFLYSQYFVDSLAEHLFEERISPLSMQVTFFRPSEREEAVQALNNMFHELSFTKKGRDEVVISASNVSKWNSILYLADRMDIHRSEIAVIGANEDDEQAVREAGIGIAMGDAPLNIKKAANWVTRKKEEGGVHYVIKELFRKQRRVETEEVNKFE